MAVQEFDIDGANVLQEVFEKLPAKYSDKIVISTMRKAARPLVKSIRSLAPRSEGAMANKVSVKAYSKIKGCPSIKVGWHAKNNEGRWAYFKAYWQNYGTLSNRAPGHTFKNARNSKTSERKGGNAPKFFIERAWEGTQKQSESIMDKDMEGIALKFLKKNAVK